MSHECARSGGKCGQPPNAMALITSGVPDQAPAPAGRAPSRAETVAQWLLPEPEPAVSESTETAAAARTVEALVVAGPAAAVDIDALFAARGVSVDVLLGRSPDNGSRRREFCRFADAHSSSLLKHLLIGMQQNDSLADGQITAAAAAPNRPPWRRASTRRRKTLGTARQQLRTWRRRPATRRSARGRAGRGGAGGGSRLLRRRRRRRR